MPGDASTDSCAAMIWPRSAPCARSTNEASGFPDDVAVTGWDNIELSRVTFPSITTIAPDLDALARRAVDMLVERVGGFAGVGRHELVDFELLVRESAPAASP